MIRIGESQVRKIYAGNQEIKKVYVNTEVVYEAGTPPIPTECTVVIYPIDAITGAQLSSEREHIAPPGETYVFEAEDLSFIHYTYNGNYMYEGEVYEG